MYGKTRFATVEVGDYSSHFALLSKDDYLKVILEAD